MANLYMFELEQEYKAQKSSLKLNKLANRSSVYKREDSDSMQQSRDSFLNKNGSYNDNNYMNDNVSLILTTKNLTVDEMVDEELRISALNKANKMYNRYSMMENCDKYRVVEEENLFDPGDGFYNITNKPFRKSKSPQQPHIFRISSSDTIQSNVKQSQLNSKKYSIQGDVKNETSDSIGFIANSKKQQDRLSDQSFIRSPQVQQSQLSKGNQSLDENENFQFQQYYNQLPKIKLIPSHYQNIHNVDTLLQNANNSLKDKKVNKTQNKPIKLLDVEKVKAEFALKLAAQQQSLEVSHLTYDISLSQNNEQQANQQTYSSYEEMPHDQQQLMYTSYLSRVSGHKKVDNIVEKTQQLRQKNQKHKNEFPWRLIK